MSPDDNRIARQLLQPRVTVRSIAQEVATAENFPVDRVLGKDRSHEACRVREKVCFIARERGFSFPQIGRTLGRNHTTIINAVRNEERRREQATKGGAQ